MSIYKKGFAESPTESPDRIADLKAEYSPQTALAVEDALRFNKGTELNRP